MSTNNFTLGNANNESILHIFNNIKMKKLRKKLLKNIVKIKKTERINNNEKAQVLYLKIRCW